MTYFADRAPRASARHGMPVRDVFQLLGIQAFPNSIRGLLEGLSYWDQVRLVRRLDPPTSAAFFQHLGEDCKDIVIQHLPASTLAHLAVHLPPGDQQALCDALPPTRRATVRKAIQYPTARPTPGG